MIGWIAKDKDGSLYFHNEKPILDEEAEWWWSNDDYIKLEEGWFPEFDVITYERSPVKVNLEIKRV